MRFDDWFNTNVDQPFYPGSKQRRDQPRATEAREVNPFYGVKPRVYQVNGEEVEFFTLGQLAHALGRAAVTIRKWEADGALPKATFLAPNPKRDQRAKRRLYSRSQAEGIVRIAAEEGVLGDSRRPIGSTNFTERVIQLFRELQK